MLFLIFQMTDCQEIQNLVRLGQQIALFLGDALATKPGIPDRLTELALLVVHAASLCIYSPKTVIERQVQTSTDFSASSQVACWTLALVYLCHVMALHNISLFILIS